MAGYADTRQMIIDTLMGRTAGTEIKPEDHQAFALQLTDYIRSVELVAGNATPIGFANASTVPVQPDNGQAVYLSSVGGAQTVTFSNFIGQNGNPITVTSTENVIKLVTLLWNGQYWSSQVTSVNAVRDTTNGYLFMGVATPTTNPGTPDQKVFYIASESGTYPNFGGLTVSDGEVAILKYNGTWTKDVTGAATAKEMFGINRDIYGRTVPKTDLPTRNGSMGNSGNVNAVVWLNIPCAGYDYIHFRITKPFAAAGNIYVFGYTLPNGTYWDNVANDITNGFYQDDINKELTLSVKGLNSFTIQCYETSLPFNYPSSCTPVRVASFASGEGLEYYFTKDNAIKGLFDAQFIINSSVFHGTDGLDSQILFEDSNITGAAPIYLRMPALFYIKFKGLSYYLRRAKVSEDIGISLVTSPRGIPLSMEIPSGKSLVYNTADNLFHLRDYTTVDDNDLLIVSVANGTVVKVGESISANFIAYNRRFAEGLYAALSGKITKFRSGTPGNARNTSCITSILVPNFGKRRVKVSTTRPVTSGYRYVFGFQVSKSFRDIGAIGINGTGAGNLAGPVISYDITATSYSGEKVIGAEYVAVGVVISESDGTNLHPVRVSDFDGYDVNISFADINESNAVVERNNLQKIQLTASCRFRKNGYSSKDFQVIIATDSHDDYICVRNAVDALNGFPTIDALIHCGDIVASTLTIDENVNSKWADIIASSSKPCYFALGNHDVGNFLGVYYTPSKMKLYNAFVKPIVDAGWLTNGEYTVNKCYYYHDFTAAKIRLIVVDEYECPLIFDDTYWAAIPYDSTLQDYTLNTEYTIGAKVNVPGYTDYSFQAVQNVTTNFLNNTIPSYKHIRGQRWLSQEQAQWFLDTLLATPANYQVIVAMHNPFSAKADVLQDVAFSQKNGWTNGYGMQNYMTNDFFADAINAFVNGSNFSTTCASIYPTEMLSYSVSKNFASKNAGVSFHSFVGGHVHQDCVWKHQIYNQYQVTPICTNSHTWQQCPNADIRRVSSFINNDIAADCLTVISYGLGRLGLVKIGVNFTENGERRDFEVIDIS